MKKKWLKYGCVFISFVLHGELSRAQDVQRDTVMLDLGNQVMPLTWNQLSDPRAGVLTDVVNTRGNATTIDVEVFDAFNGINHNGTTTPDPHLGFIPNAT